MIVSLRHLLGWMVSAFSSQGGPHPRKPGSPSAIAGSARATTPPSIDCPAQAVLGCVENVLVRVDQACITHISVLSLYRVDCLTNSMYRSTRLDRHGTQPKTGQRHGCVEEWNSHSTRWRACSTLLPRSPLRGDGPRRSPLRCHRAATSPRSPFLDNFRFSDHPEMSRFNCEQNFNSPRPLLVRTGTTKRRPSAEATSPPPQAWANGISSCAATRRAFAAVRVSSRR
jgi:hypothetical protein